MPCWSSEGQLPPPPSALKDTRRALLPVTALPNPTRAGNPQPSINEHASRESEKVDVRRKPSSVITARVSFCRFRKRKQSSSPLPHVSRALVVTANDNGEKWGTFSFGVIVVKVSKSAVFRRAGHRVKVRRRTHRLQRSAEEESVQQPPSAPSAVHSSPPPPKSPHREINSLGSHHNRSSGQRRAPPCSSPLDRTAPPKRKCRPGSRGSTQSRQFASLSGVVVW
jgi:hypothetical protein